MTTLEKGDKAPNFTGRIQDGSTRSLADYSGKKLVLYFYHFSLHIIYKQLQNKTVKYTSAQLRIWNELPTIILIAVVFLVIKKDGISWIWGTIGIISVSVLLMLAINFYKRFRENKQ